VDFRGFPTPKYFHARSCTTSGLLTSRHEAIAQVLATIIRSAGCRGLAFETSEYFVVGAQGQAGGNLRMDIVIPADELDRKAVLIDVTVRDPTLPSNNVRGERETGAVAHHAAEGKKLKYMGSYDPTTSKLIPFAVETCGTLGKDAYELLKSLARLKVAGTPASIVELAGVDGTEAQVGRWLQYYTQAVSIRLQRALGHMEVHHRSVTRRQARQRGA